MRHLYLMRRSIKPSAILAHPPTDIVTTPAATMLSTTALRILRDVAETAQVPPLRALAGVALVLLESAEQAAINKDACSRLCENVFELLSTISHELNSQDERLPDELLDYLDDLQVKLICINQFIRDNLKRKSFGLHFIMSSRYAQVLRGYQEDIRRALEVFELQAKLLMHRTLNAVHARKVEWAESFPPDLDELATGALAQAPPPYRPVGSLPTSSYTERHLPPRPAIFIGREEELQAVVSLITDNESSRIAVLGGGGMGKTSLALSALHRPEVTQRFDGRRFFVPCDAADSKTAFITLLASTFNISSEHPRLLLSQIVQWLSFERSIIVLDNFETPWESAREEIETVLAILCDISTLTLIITMRGIERPASVDWTRPLQQPLQPLELVAARQVFLTISDVDVDNPHIDELLEAVDFVPLSLTLMANLAQYEGTMSLLSRWQENETEMLSPGGSDKRSSLDQSIRMSIESARVRQAPDAMSVLYVLSMAPDGLEREVLLKILGQLEHPARTLSVLVQTALAQRLDDGKRVHVLAPIRHFVLNYHRDQVSDEVLSACYAHFISIAELGKSMGTPATRPCAAVLLQEILNTETVFIYALKDHRMSTSQRIAVASATAHLALFTRYTALGTTQPLLRAMNYCRAAEEKATLADILMSLAMLGVLSPGTLPVGQYVEEAQVIYTELQNSRGIIECTHRNWTGPRADRERTTRALTLAEELGDETQQALCHIELGQTARTASDWVTARQHFLTAQGLLRGVGECHHQARCLYWLGNITCRDGRFDDAMEQFNNALSLYDSLDCFSGNAHCNSSMGWVYNFQGECTLGIAHSRQAMLAFGKLGYVMDGVLASLQLTHCYVVALDLPAAKDTLSRALEGLRKTSPQWNWGRGHGAAASGAVAELEGNTASAREYYQQAIGFLQRCKAFDEETEVHVRVGHLALSQGDSAAALRHFVVASIIESRDKTIVNYAMGLNGLADVLLTEDQFLTALSITRAVLPSLNAMRLTGETARAVARLGSLSLSAEDEERARAFFIQARALYDRAGHRAGCARCDSLLAQLPPLDSV